MYRALYNSTALRAPDWPRRIVAFLHGCASVRRLEHAEIAALPELLIARPLGSVLWLATRWRAGLGHFGEITNRVGRLEATTRWLAVNEDALLSVAAAATQTPDSPGHVAEQDSRSRAARGAADWRPLPAGYKLTAGNSAVRAVPAFRRL